MTRRERYEAVVAYFEKAMPVAETELRYDNVFQLLVAVVLSAQCTDKRVNMVTPALFEAFPTAEAMAAATEEEVLAYVKSVSYPNSKARHLVATARQLCERFGGEVPSTLEELTQLPGVGRKTANVVLGNAFGVPGITVDTHFGRLARRFGWTTAEDPDKVEAEVGSLFPKRDWTMLSHHLIWHGRRRCHAKKPACGACPVARWCPSYGEGPTDPVEAARLVRDSGPA